MSIHIGFVTSERTKDYTFLDRHTNKEIAYGHYTNGNFEVIGDKVNGVECFVSAAVAWRELNQRLIDEYGW
jgi:hypothetical protein